MPARHAQGAAGVLAMEVAGANTGMQVMIAVNVKVGYTEKAAT